MNNGEKSRVGFVGLGLMGGGMARNLAKAGFPLTIFNRTHAKADALASETGCAVADTPADVAASADIVITMVSDVPDVEQVYFGAGGIAESAGAGLLAIDMGTVGKACVVGVAERLASRQVDFIDAPVSGGSWGAANGTLSIMAGGSDDAFERALPLFEAMGKKIVHCGPVGSGQTTKMVNQIVGAINLEATAEGMLFALRSGLTIDKTVDAVGAGAAGSWSWTNHGPRMAASDYAPGFKIAHQIKDLRLALDAAKELGIDLPGTRLVLSYLQQTEDAAPGNGELGTQAIISALQPQPN